MTELTAFDCAEGFGLSARAALVTGAAHGLGYAVATALAGAGASVALVDVDEDALRDAVSVVGERAPAVPLTANVRDGAAVDAAVAAAAAEFGRLDIVVNAAGIFPSIPFAETSTEMLLEILDINVAGSARVTRAALPHLTAHGVGRVINFASVMTFTGLPIGKSAYVASKSALIGLTRALARELGPAQVTVNALAPGAISGRSEPSPGPELAELEELVLEQQSLKRRGTARDIAAGALFLAGDAAAFITGQTLLIDGGWAFG